LGFSVGEGKTLWKKTGQDRFFIFKLMPTEGFVSCLKDRGTYSRLGEFMVSAGGPLFTLLCLGITWVSWFVIDWSFLGETPAILVRQTLALLMTMTAISLAYNLWPHDGVLSGSSVANDGKQMLAALLGKGYPSANHYQRNLQKFAPVNQARTLPETPEAREAWVRYYSLLMQEDWSQAETILDEATRLPGIHPEEAAAFHDAFADQLFSSREFKKADQAEAHINQALEKLPDSEYLRARKGVLLVFQRFYNDGRRLLNEVLDETNENRIRALCHCYLAIADAGQNEEESGKHHLKQAAKWDPYTPDYVLAHELVHRIPQMRRDL
ncbi:MAG: hypothetical protein AAF514_10760, partial [Verrucomicrobiota bacterium]